LVCLLGKNSDLLKLPILVDVKIGRFQTGNQPSLGCGDCCQHSSEIHADSQFVVALLVGARLAEQRECEEGEEQEK
jgi:hypothetical protein